ncbi:MAG: serine/threonine protein kinase [Candidatus Sericytochromatia bacterium]
MLTRSDLNSLTQLAQGPGTRVWKGTDREGRHLLLKTFSLVDAPDWKAQELFTREAQVLQQLEHPLLPRLLAYGMDGEISYLIYPFIEGESLQAKLDAGWRPDQEQVFALIRQLLETLIWLHARQPPLIHRDIKPSNLILAADQQLFLIDFGSVVQYLKPHGGSTVAGTFGYMAPEQLTGRALPASDLYAVGSCLIYLLSGRPPAELPQERLWIRFEEYVQISAPLKRWLKTLIDPVLEERCPDARTALASLEQALRAPDLPALKSRQADEAYPTRFKRPPQPEEPDVKAIEVLAVPQGLSILLPFRESDKRVDLEYGRSAFVIGMSFLVLLIIYGNWLMPFLVSHLYLFLGLIAACGAAVYYREIRLTSRQFQLTLTALQLDIKFSDKPKAYQIPWTQIQTIQQKNNRRGVSVKYTDPVTHRGRRLSIGQRLASYEQYWLIAILQEQQTRFSQTALPQTNPNQLKERL